MIHVIDMPSSANKVSLTHSVHNYTTQKSLRIKAALYCAWNNFNTGICLMYYMSHFRKENIKDQL